MTFLAAAVALLGVAAVAFVPPTRRAVRIEPREALADHFDARSFHDTTLGGGATRLVRYALTRWTEGRPTEEDAARLP